MHHLQEGIGRRHAQTLTNNVDGRSLVMRPQIQPTYCARWQPNAFIHRALAEPADAMGLLNLHITNHFILRCDELYCVLDYGARAMVWKSDSTNPDDNPVSRSIEERLVSLNEVLNMGVAHLKPGSIRWTRDSFDEVSSSERQIRVTGTLTPSENGRVNELHVSYSDLGWVAKYRIQYEYDKPLGVPGIPSSIKAYLLYKGAETLCFEIRISHLKASPGPFDLPAFDPAPFLRENNTVVLSVTNGAIFLLDPEGSPRFFARLPKSDRSRLGSLNKQSVAIAGNAVFLVMNISFLALSVRARRVRKEIHNH